MSMEHSNNDPTGKSRGYQVWNLKFVAVHLGVSNSVHGREKESLARRVCEQVMLCDPILESKTDNGCRTNQLVDEIDSARKFDHYSAEDAVVRLVKLMEDESILNCGFGSNLNMDGFVECDASMATSRNQSWAGVGAVSCCKNPIVLAKNLHDRLTQARPLGLVQPNFLVGSGARHWMKRNCRDLFVPTSRLISQEALSKYQKYKSRYDAALNSEHALADRASFREARLETVGAIAVDYDDNIASAVSSGGIILKYPGRVGQAGVPGAGCWAQEFSATTTTGVGEYLIATLFAKLFHEKVKERRAGFDPTMNLDNETTISDAMVDCFEDLNSARALAHVPSDERFAGLLGVSIINSTNLQKRDGQPESVSGGETGKYSGELNEKGLKDAEYFDKLYLAYGHNTRSMCIGFMARGDNAAKSVVSRHHPNDHSNNEDRSRQRNASITVQAFVVPH